MQQQGMYRLAPAWQEIKRRRTGLKFRGTGFRLEQDCPLGNLAYGVTDSILVWCLNRSLVIMNGDAGRSKVLLRIICVRKHIFSTSRWKKG